MKKKVKRYYDGDLVDSTSEFQGFGQVGPRTIQENINAEAEEQRRLQQAARAAGTAGEDTGVGQLAGGRYANDEDTGVGLLRGVTARAPSAGRQAQAAVRPTVRPATQPVKPAAPSRQEQAAANLRRLQEIDKPLERVTPEMNLLGGPLLRTLKGAGSAMAARLAARPTAMAKRGERGLAPTEKDMGPVELAKKPALTRSPERNRRRLLTGSKESEAMNMRKGGKVSSASKRADGIAMRGKTRGKYI